MAPVEPAAEVPDTTAYRLRVIFAGTVGNAIEFYDFTVYAFLAVYFVNHFFPLNDPVAGLLASYGALAAGMIMRPVGGVIIGSLGDRLGRKLALQVSIAMIALPTLLIGLLPTYQQIGMAAPILLISLRMIQGLSVGGEYSASIIYIIEQAPPARRGLWGSFNPMGGFGGIFLGAAVCIIVTNQLGAAQMSDWGWRVPFIASIALTLAGVAVRLRLGVESRVALLKKHRVPVLLALRVHWRALAAIALANVSTGIVTFVGFTYTVSWMELEAGVSRQHALGVNLCALLMAAAFSVLGGMAGDRFGRLRVATAGLVVLVLGAWPALTAIASPALAHQLAGLALLALGQGLFVGPMCACMTTLVPMHVRATIVSLGYGLSVGIFGGLAPMVTEYMLSRLGFGMAPAIVIMAGAVASLATLTLSRSWRSFDPRLPEER